MPKLILCLMIVCFLSIGTAEGGNKFARAHGETKGTITISLNKRILSNENLEPVVKKGGGRFDNTLAMDVFKEQLPELREKISSVIGRPLTFFKQWNPEGEGHITVITPVEYFDILQGEDATKPIISMEKIAEIAKQFEMQKSTIEILSMGSGKKLLDGKMEETFFLIVKSENLLKIRRAVHTAFVENGGNSDAWNPERFFPHITVGYTLRDLHEADGILKDVPNSCDSRFKIKMTE